ncbi:unnamed protein product, partial [Parnassius apollo]
YAIVSAAVRSPLGGDHLAAQAKNMLNNMHIQMLPIYSIQSKEVIRERERARYTLKTLPAGLTQSWQQYMLKRQYEDFYHCVAQVSESSYDERTAASVPGVHYEFPGGYHQDFGPERFKLTECLFEQNLGAPHLVCSAAAACDADARPALWGAVVACGGLANLGGWLERVSRELAARAPSSHRLKTHAAPSPPERRFAAWLGTYIAQHSAQPGRLAGAREPRAGRARALLAPPQNARRALAVRAPLRRLAWYVRSTARSTTRAAGWSA